MATLSQLLSKHASRGLLIDTNVLLLYLVGLFDVSFVERFKRTRSYTGEDFILVGNLIGYFNRLVTTPHILAELSNLSLQMKEPYLSRYFARIVKVLQGFREESVSKDSILAPGPAALLPKLGFTDLSIMEAAKSCTYLVLTDDFRIAEYLRRSNCDVINLNQLRGELWLAE